jgi:DNA-binding NarL/FixJ family response regulator
MNIVIADPQARVRFGLRILLEQQAGWMVVAEAVDSQELLALVQKTRPDLVLLDWNLLEQPVETFIRRLRAQHPGLLLLAMNSNQGSSQAALSAGMDGFTSKMEAPEKLLDLIRKLASGKDPAARV